MSEYNMHDKEMKNVLEAIEKYVDCFPYKKYADYVTIEDTEGNKISVPSHCAFNCMVLGLKATGYRRNLFLVHHSISRLDKDGEWYEDEDYNTYRLMDDNFVHRVYNYSRYSVYGEREIA